MNNLVTVIDEIDISKILLDLKNIESSIQWANNKTGKSTMLQHPAWSKDIFLGMGYLHNMPDVVNNDGTKRKPVETDFNLVHDIYQNTIFEEIIKKYKLYRTRLMEIKSYSNYGFHRDPTLRIHIPLITSKDCYFIFKDHGVFHLESGKVYLVDTRHRHSAGNFTDQDRLHLVGCVEYDNYTN